MTQTISELYDALRAAGVKDDLAKAAARSVIAIEDKTSLVTKSDLAAAVGELKADLTWRIVLAMGAQVAIFTAITAAMKLVRP